MPAGRRPVVIALVLGALLAGAAAAWGVPGFSTAPQSKPAAGSGQAELFDLKLGCHADYDRLVIRTRFGTPAFSVRYVPAIVQPSGRPLTLRGTSRLQVQLRPARGHTIPGASLLPAVANPGCASLLQLKRAEDFEGVVTLGLGIQGRKPFRVFRPTSPARVVVDVAH